MGNTPTRPIRVEPELWDRFGEIVGERNRSEAIREYMRWMVGEPGTKRPTRPKPSE